MKGSEHLIKAFYGKYGLVRHHIDSFNRFINTGMQQVVDEVGEIIPAVVPEGCSNFRIKFGRITIGQPVAREADGSSATVLPNESRIRAVTYMAPIYLELIAEKDGVRSETITAELGSMPIMIRSDACFLSKMTKDELISACEDPLDTGGYFIINGTERAIIAIEDLRGNMPMLERKKSGPSTEIARLFSEAPGLRVPHLIERLKDGSIRVSFGRITKVPFGVLMFALGLESDEEIMKATSTEEGLLEDIMINLEDIGEIKTTEDALDWIGKQMRIGQGREYRIQRVQELIDQYLFPHLGVKTAVRKEKALYLGNIGEKLIRFHYDMIPEDDKDHYGNKRLKLAGELMEQLFRASFKTLVNDMKYSFERITKRGREPSLDTIVRSQLFTSRIESALSTGYWVGGRTGVSQHLQRLNYMDTLSHLRRVLSPLTASQPHFEARELHTTHWGKLCASETPEGQNIGLRKNLAIMAKVTHSTDETSVLKALGSQGVE